MFWRRDHLTQRELELFTSHLSTLLDSGIGLLPALQALAEGGEARLSACLDRVMRDIEGGESFSGALQRQPASFPVGYRRVVENAEQVGQLPLALQKMAITLERQTRIKKQVIQSLTYPAFLVFFSVLLVAGVVYGIVPVVLQVTVEAGVQPPLLTQMLIWLANPKLALGAAAALLGWAFLLYQFCRRPRCARLVQSFLERHTPMGQFFVQVQLLSVMRQFALMLETGTDLLRSILYSGRLGEDSLLLREALHDLYEGVRSGETISDCMAMHTVFPQDLASMVAVSEEIGGTHSLVRRYCDMLEARLESQLDALISVLEPSLIGMLGFIIGLILIASFLPLYHLVAM